MDISLHTLVDRVRAATADGTALRIRGGGSKDFLADQLHGDVLDMTAHSGMFTRAGRWCTQRSGIKGE
jgi:glycolate oxidase FAD binding subunit